MVKAGAREWFVRHELACAADDARRTGGCIGRDGTTAMA